MKKPLPGKTVDELILELDTAFKSRKDEMPKSLGEAIDKLYLLRAERLALARLVDARKEVEASMKSHLMSNFAGQAINGAKGSIATASIKKSIQAEITDFFAYLKWAVKQKNPALVQKRVGIEALREYWNNGKVADGVTQTEVEDLSLTKVGK